MSWNQITFFVKFWVLIQDENEHHQKKPKQYFVFDNINRATHPVVFNSIMRQN